MTIWVALIALGALCITLMLWPLWFQNRDEDLGVGIENDETAWLWAQEKERLLQEQKELDAALDEGKISPDLHQTEKAAVAVDAQRALERHRQAKDSAAKAVDQSEHRPKVYPAMGAAFASVIVLATGVLVFELKGLDIHRAQKQAGAPQAGQVGMAEIQGMVASLEARVLAGEGSDKDRLMLARSYRVLGKRKKALALYDKISKAEPKNLTVIMALGEMYFNSSEPIEQNKAIGYFDQALAIDANLPEALWFKSLALVRNREFQKARDLLVRLQKAAPDNAQAQEAVARLLQELDKNIKTRDKEEKEPEKAGG